MCLKRTRGKAGRCVRAQPTRGQTHIRGAGIDRAQCALLVPCSRLFHTQCSKRSGARACGAIQIRVVTVLVTVAVAAVAAVRGVSVSAA